MNCGPECIIDGCGSADFFGNGSLCRALVKAGYTNPPRARSSSFMRVPNPPQRFIYGDALIKKRCFWDSRKVFVMNYRRAKGAGAAKPTESLGLALARLPSDDNAIKAIDKYLGSGVKLSAQDEQLVTGGRRMNKMQRMKRGVD